MLANAIIEAASGGIQGNDPGLNLLRFQKNTPSYFCGALKLSF